MANDPIFATTPVVSTAFISTTNPALGSMAPIAFAWGLAGNGNIGDNANTSRRTPVFVAGSIPFSQLCIGNIGGAIRQSDGTCWGWGVATSGEVGDNQTAANRSSPVSVVGGHLFMLLSKGVNFSMALKKDGTAWAWGSNTYGRLGDNSATNRSSPVSVIGAHSFTMAFAGYRHSAALKFDGTAWCWGDAASGATGDNTATNRSSPVSVVGAHVFTSIVAGTARHVIALKQDGSVWCWGANDRGEIGDGTTTNRSSPVSVVGGHSFQKISTGYKFSIGIKSDGSMWTWGNNTQFSGGALGDGTLTDRSSPVSVLGGHSFTVASGFTTTTALKETDGSIWAWGENLNTGTGILGDDTAINRSSPVSVVSPIRFTSFSTNCSGRLAGALGVGPMSLLMSGATNGTRVDYVVIKALGTTTAGVIRFWVDNGSMTAIRLFKEVLVTAITASASVAAFEAMVFMAEVLPSGARMWVSTEKGERFNITAFGGNF